MTLGPQPPNFDFTKWSGLADLLRQKYRVVTEQVDNMMPPGALASFVEVVAGTATYPTLTVPGAIGGVIVTSGAVSGNAAAVRAYNTVAAANENIVPANFGVLALTVEGLGAVGGSGTPDSGFDFEMGFPGTGTTIGGCQLLQQNGEINAEIDTYSAGGTISRSPRVAVDGVTTANSTTITSAADAQFASTDVGLPIATFSGGPFVPGTTITAVASATSATISIPALTSGTGVNFYIGQGVNAKVLASSGGSRFHRNLSLVWFTLDGYVWVMEDDQVLAEVNLNQVANYDTAEAVFAQVSVTTRQAFTAALFYQRLSLIYGHN